MSSWWFLQLKSPQNNGVLLFFDFGIIPRYPSRDSKNEMCFVFVVFVLSSILGGVSVGRMSNCS